MNIDAWVAGKVQSGEEATVSLAILEKGIPSEVPAMRVIEDWASKLADKLGCKASIFYLADVVTFYPVSKL